MHSTTEPTSEAPRSRWHSHYWPLPPVLEAGLAALVPALLAGLHLTGLLYFLNPHLDLSLRGLGEGALRLALLLVPLSFAGHWLGTRIRNVRVRRLLPWSLTVVLGAAALGDWVHASRYSFYLPPGINANLIRTALWLSFASIVAFYTALLHTEHHRPYGRRSLILLVVVVVGSLGVMVDRRASYARLVAEPAPFARLPVRRRTCWWSGSKARRSMCCCRWRVRGVCLFSPPFSTRAAMPGSRAFRRCDRSRSGQASAPASCLFAMLSPVRA